MTKIIRTNIIIISAIYFIFTACTKELNSEIIGESTELKTIELISGNKNDTCNYLITKDDGIIYYSTNKESSVIIYKMSIDGKINWKVNSKDIPVNLEQINNVVETSEGDLLVVGNEIVENGTDVLLLKFSETGEYLYHKSYDVLKFDIGKNICSTYDNGYAIACIYKQEQEDQVFPKYYGVIKIDYNFDIEWISKNGLAFNNLSKVIQTRDNNFYVLLNDISNLYKVVKLDNRGVFLDYVILDYFNVFDIINADNDNYLICELYYHNEQKLGVTKFDDEKNIKWQITLPVKVTSLELIDYKIRKLINTGYYLTIREHDAKKDIFYNKIIKINNSGELIE